MTDRHFHGDYIHAKKRFHCRYILDPRMKLRVGGRKNPNHYYNYLRRPEQSRY